MAKSRDQLQQELENELAENPQALGDMDMEEALDYLEFIEEELGGDVEESDEVGQEL